MSAIRTSSHSRASRTNQLPYARHPPKKSSWSFTGLLGYLNPLRSRTPTEAINDSSDDSDVSQESNHVQQSPAQSLSQRGHQMAQDIQYQIAPKETHLLARSSPPHTSSPERQLETVSAHLKESLGAEGVEKLVSLLQRGTYASEALEPFRFSTSPTTPARGNSPFLASPSGFGSSIGASETPTTSPRRTLNKNPNGVYRWQGGGSARTPRTKNRYSSPAFGPPRSTPGRLVLGDSQFRSEPSNADNKRRRVDHETGDSPTKSSGPVSEFPMRSATSEPSSVRAQQAIPFPVTVSPVTPRTTNGVSSNIKPLPRVRTPPYTFSQKPTAPAVPSPLRQTWSGAFPSQSDQSPTTPPPSKQTKTANFITELIKEVTPPKRPDLSNPYQAASPVKKTNTKPRPRVARRARATGRPTTPVLGDDKSKLDEAGGEQTKVYSPQAIIEATLPKGSKRSRPPNHLVKLPLSGRKMSPPSDQPTSVNSTNSDLPVKPKFHATYMVEEIDEEIEDMKRTGKKLKPLLAEREAKPTNGKGKPVTQDASDMVIEEIEEVHDGDLVEKPQSVSSPPPQLASGSISTTLPGRPPYAGPKPKTTSVPKEPSKLRFSYQPEQSNSPAPSPPSPSATPITSPTAQPPPAPNVDKNDLVGGPEKTLLPAKQAALSVSRNFLPKYSFSRTFEALPSSPLHQKTRQAVESLLKSSLPTFDISDQSITKPPSFSDAKVFDWGGAGVKPPPVPSTAAAWECTTCMLSNSSSATDKCAICDAPRPNSSKSVPAVKPFDWAAAGVKPPVSGNAATWTCSTCMLSNPASAKDKCAICDTPR